MLALISLGPGDVQIGKEPYGIIFPIDMVCRTNKLSLGNRDELPNLLGKYMCACTHIDTFIRLQPLGSHLGAEVFCQVEIPITDT